MNVRELPHRVDGLPVVKATYLGWLSHYAAEPGYFCVVITHGSTGEGGAYHVHVLRALGLDKPWRRIDSHHGQVNGEANVKFNEIEKLAEWGGEA